MRLSPIAGFVSQLANKYEIPGVAVGVWTNGKAYLACHGVTDLDQSKPIEPDTPFPIASVTKTFTATAMMRLVADQYVELHAPVQRYLPDFRWPTPWPRRADDGAEPAQPHRRSGLGSLDRPDDSSDALARYVSALRNQQLIAALGTRVSYSQAGYNIAGRIISEVKDRHHLRTGDRKLGARAAGPASQHVRSQRGHHLSSGEGTQCVDGWHRSGDPSLERHQGQQPGRRACSFCVGSAGVGSFPPR